MFEVIIAGGPSDGRILGEFREYKDALDMAVAFNYCNDSHHEDEVAIVQLMEV